MDPIFEPVRSDYQFMHDLSDRWDKYLRRVRVQLIRTEPQPDNRIVKRYSVNDREMTIDIFREDLHWEIAARVQDPDTKEYEMKLRLIYDGDDLDKLNKAVFEHILSKFKVDGTPHDEEPKQPKQKEKEEEKVEDDEVGKAIEDAVQEGKLNLGLGSVFKAVVDGSASAEEVDLEVQAYLAGLPVLSKL